MKLASALICAVLLVAGCDSKDTEDLRRLARMGFPFPATLSSPDAARAFVRASPPGGRVDLVRIGTSRYMVVCTHGSGVPITGIAVYRRKLLYWEIDWRVRPPHERLMIPQEPFKEVIVSEGKIIGVGGLTSQKWVLHDPTWIKR
jgi:hypothetical protein